MGTVSEHVGPGAFLGCSLAISLMSPQGLPLEILDYTPTTLLLQPLRGTPGKNGKKPLALCPETSCAGSRRPGVTQAPHSSSQGP